MKLELKENMYIRTKYGIIDKILKLNKSYVKGVSQKDELYAYDIDNIVKASYNIIDILKKGDYVNGIEVINIDDEWITMSDTQVPILKSIANGLIKTIVTKEQFESMSYKLED